MWLYVLEQNLYTNVVAVERKIKKKNWTAPWLSINKKLNKDSFQNLQKPSISKGMHNTHSPTFIKPTRPQIQTATANNL